LINADTPIPTFSKEGICEDAELSETTLAGLPEGTIATVAYTDQKAGVK
jgi:hypothetical protein